MWGYPSTTFESYASVSSRDKFLCYKQGQDIITDTGTGPMVVGVSVETYQALKDTATKYRDRLMELVPDEMAPPLTTEQINEQLVAELKASREASEKLMAVIHNLTSQKEAQNDSGQDTVSSTNVFNA